MVCNKIVGYHCSVRRQQLVKRGREVLLYTWTTKETSFFCAFFQTESDLYIWHGFIFWMCHSWKPDGFIISRGLSVLVLYSVFKRGSFWRTSGVYFCEITRKLGLCLGLFLTSTRSKYNWFHGKNPVLTAIHADNSEWLRQCDKMRLWLSCLQIWRISRMSSMHLPAKVDRIQKLISTIVWR